MAENQTANNATEEASSGTDWAGIFQTALQSVGQGATSYYSAKTAQTNANAAQAQTTAQANAQAALAAENRKTLYIAAGVAVVGVLALVLITSKRR